MPRPKKNKHLSPRDRLMITAYLEYHRSRALNGVETATKAMEISPSSSQFIGMANHFTKLVAVIEDMLACLDGKQEWMSYFEAACAELEIDQ